MIALYLVVLLLLALVQVFVRLRVKRLEKRYTRIAADADRLLKATATRGGNNNRPDAILAAKQQYELAQLALKRDRLEGRYGRWQSFSERFAGFRGRLACYRGRLVPYLFGLADVAAAVVVLDRLGVGVSDIRSMIGM